MNVCAILDAPRYLGKGALGILLPSFLEVFKGNRVTYTASAAPARMILVSEKNLCAPFPFAPNDPAPAPRPLLDAFKHKNLGLVQLRKEPIDASAEATARTVLCIMI